MFAPHPPFVYYNYRDVLKKDSTRNISFVYKYNIAKSCKDSLIRFFFINDTIFYKNSLDTIGKYHLYEKKMIFSDEDLEKMNYTIEYK